MRLIGIVAMLALLLTQGVKAQDIGTLHPGRPIPPITAKIDGVYFFTCTKSAVTLDEKEYSVDVTWGTYIDFRDWRDFHISYVNRAMAHVKGLDFDPTNNPGSEDQAYKITITGSLQAALPEVYKEVIKLKPPYGIVYACPTEEDRDYVKQIEMGFKANDASI